jgi:hypothetical protein
MSADVLYMAIYNKKSIHELTNDINRFGEILL